jgi:hypothetical protein
VKYGGLVREDVMEKIWNISNIPLPFTEMCSSGTHTNRRAEWTEDTLATPVTTNAVVEGADANQNDAKTGARLGNYTQISIKEVKVTDSSQQSDSIGGAGKLSYQIMERQKELRRDVEAQMLTHQASVAGDADAIPGISAGLGAQLKTNVRHGVGGVPGGFNDVTGLFVAPTPGAAAALSETTIRDVLQGVYEAGGNSKKLMARPTVIRKLSEYMFGPNARVATLTATTPNPATGDTALKAYGSVNVFISDFGQTVEMQDNRIQQPDAAGVSTMYFLDPAHLRQSIFRGYQVEPLAKTGLSEKRLMSVQYTLEVLNEKSQGAIMDIDETAAVVA